MYQSDSRIAPFIRDWMLAPLSGVTGINSMLARIAGGGLVAPLRGGVIQDR